MVEFDASRTKAIVIRSADRNDDIRASTVLDQETMKSKLTSMGVNNITTIENSSKASNSAGDSLLMKEQILGSLGKKASSRLNDHVIVVYSGHGNSKDGSFAMKESTRSGELSREDFDRVHSSKSKALRDVLFKYNEIGDAPSRELSERDFKSHLKNRNGGELNFTPKQITTLYNNQEALQDMRMSERITPKEFFETWKENVAGHGDKTLSLAVDSCFSGVWKEFVMNMSEEDQNK